MTTLLGERRICFYGAGAMAEAIVRGLVGRQIAEPDRISLINRSNNDRLLEMHERYGVSYALDRESRNNLLREADIIVLAMKPKDAGAAIAAAKTLLSPDALIVSVIAGLSIATVETILDRPAAVVRTMPNTSSTIGLGATGLSFSTEVSKEQKELALAMFRSIGEVAVVEEQLLDIVTGVSGSGPAYVYYLMEAMIEAGVQGGLSEQDARRLTVQTVLGAAEMVKTTQEEPGALRRKVTSPNGTTQAALETMDDFRFADGVRQAVLRAAERAGELGAAIAANITK